MPFTLCVEVVRVSLVFCQSVFLCHILPPLFSPTAEVPVLLPLALIDFWLEPACEPYLFRSFLCLGFTLDLMYFVPFPSTGVIFSLYPYSNSTFFSLSFQIASVLSEF